MKEDKKKEPEKKEQDETEKESEAELKGFDDIETEKC